MGSSTSRVVGCLVPFGNGKEVDLDFLEPLDEGLGHSFCYVRPVITDSPAITPSNSERYTVDSSTMDSEMQSSSFRREIVEDSVGLPRSNKNYPETTFKTISGASVSANVSTARSVNQNALLTSDAQEPAASFESTASFAAIPLQPVPRGSGPLNGFMSGPLERGIASGPLERGGGFMSGPIERGAFMSGPLDSTDKANFSAPLVYSRRRAGFGHLVRSMSRPMRNAFSRTFSRHSTGSGWMRRFFLHPMTQFVWHPKEAKFRPEVPRNCFEVGPSESEYSNSRNLQWAHGKAGEDRVHVVLSEEQGWLFVGIYDGFSGPDAPDFLMSNLYRAIDKELEGLLWDYEDNPRIDPPVSGVLENEKGLTLSGGTKEHHGVSQSCEVVMQDGLEQMSGKDTVDNGNVQIQSSLKKASAHESVERVKQRGLEDSSCMEPMDVHRNGDGSNTRSGLEKASVCELVEVKLDCIEQSSSGETVDVHPYVGGSSSESGKEKASVDESIEGGKQDDFDEHSGMAAVDAHPNLDVSNTESGVEKASLDESLEAVKRDGLEELSTLETADMQPDADDSNSETRVQKTSVDELEATAEIVEEKCDAGKTYQDLCTSLGEKMVRSEAVNCSRQAASHVSTEKLVSHGRRSKRLYELLQMEDSDIESSPSVSEFGRKRASWNLQPSVEDLCSREEFLEAQPLSYPTNTNDSGSSPQLDVSSRQDTEVAVEEPKHGTVASFPVLGNKHLKRSLIGSKLKKMYRKQKSLRKKLFPWSYDWHRDQVRIDERTVDSSAPIQRCKSGPVDHMAVMEAMSRALETTEEAYMDMVEKTLDKNPELALMGSCVLVMLMKDQDVYVMNLGDSRVILAQERLSDRHANQNIAKDDVRFRNRSRESLVRVELDRISEESPMHNQTSRMSNVNKSREISICRLKTRAIQLSTDHSTSIEEEVMRIKAEHADDNQAILNDRVKGQLKVTRAFGAGFLKKPKCNEAVLEVFRIDYVGDSPYLSCIPSVLHHRLCSNDRFLILSSDGLYQYFSNEEVVSHVAWFMENVPEGDPAQYLIAELLFRAAKKNGMDFHELLDIPQGDRRKYHDDVSVMVISLEGRIWRSSG